MNSSAPNHRRPELDFLRGVAILLVLGRHMLWVPDSGAGWAGVVFRAWRHFGWMGVDLFFVLSGFLVGGLLIREERRFGVIRPWAFLLRRGLRIYPPFYFFLLGSLLLGHVVGLRFPTWPTGLWSELFFYQNYVPGLWPQTWSLAVEEHFYLLLAGMLFWMSRREPLAQNHFHAFPRWVLVVNTTLLFGRIIAAYVMHSSWNVLTFRTHWRLDSLLFGVLLAYGVECYPTWMKWFRGLISPWRFIGIPLLIGPSMAMNLNEDRYLWSFGATALYLGFGWILLESILGDPAVRSRAVRVLPFLPAIGKHSYSTYLWHFTLYCIGFAYLHRKLRMHLPLTVECLGFVCAAIVCGMIMSHCVEQPLLRWRDRLFPSRATGLPKTALS